MSDLKHDVTTCHVTAILEPFPTFMNFTGNLKKNIINTCNQLVSNWKKPTTMLSKIMALSTGLHQNIIWFLVEPLEIQVHFY